MGAYKQFLTTDVIVSPFEVHKEFDFYGTSLIDPNVGIERLLGRHITTPTFDLTEPVTGQLGSQYQRLVYHSIKELYYTNYLTCSYGDLANRPVLIPGVSSSGDVLIGSASSTNYYNYLQTDLSYPKFFPTWSNATIGVISIPVRLFGDYIEPYSFTLSIGNGTGSLVLTDDGEGNILFSSSRVDNEIVGNIFYPHGIITITGNPNVYSSSYTFTTSSVYGTAVYGNVNSTYGGLTPFYLELLAFITSSNITCSFNSTYTIYENQYKCTIRENEFNYTLNPSTFTSSLSGSVLDINFNLSPCDVTASLATGSTLIQGIPYDYVNQFYFSPYITTIGLYNEAQELLAVTKLSQPLPTSPTTDTTILINLDR